MQRTKMNHIGTGPRFVSAAEDKVCGSYNNVRGLLDDKTKVEIYPCGGAYKYIYVPSEEALPPCPRYAKVSLRIFVSLHWGKTFTSKRMEIATATCKLGSRGSLECFRWYTEKDFASVTILFIYLYLSFIYLPVY